MAKMDLHEAIGNEETILWEGKPNRRCFIFESIFNPMLIIGLIWAGIDITLLAFGVIDSHGNESAILGFVIFVFFHMMPVWIYLMGVLAMVLRYRNSYYIITDQHVYVSRGVFSFHYNLKPLKDLPNVNIRQGIFDKLFHVGDVVLDDENKDRPNQDFLRFQLINLTEYEKVASLIKEHQK